MTLKLNSKFLAIKIPQNVKIKIGQNWIILEGPGGKLIKKKDQNILLYHKFNMLLCLNTPNLEIKKFLNFILQNIKSISIGFITKLKIQGVGYKWEIEDNKIKLKLGFSHSVYYNIPENIKCHIPKNKNSLLIIKGFSKQNVNQFANEIRSLKLPEVYKGKGIRFTNEYIKLKEGKKSNV